jgi:hypothetical protein
MLPPTAAPKLVARMRVTAPDRSGVMRTTYHGDRQTKE